MAYFVLVLVTLVTLTYQQVMDLAYMKKWQDVREECIKEVGADGPALIKAWDENRFPDDQKFKCYYKCCHLKLGVLDAAGEVVDDKLGEMASQLNDIKTKEEIVEECGPLKGVDLCETAYKLMACIKAAKLD